MMAAMGQKIVIPALRIYRFRRPAPIILWKGTTMAAEGKRPYRARAREIYEQRLADMSPDLPEDREKLIEELRIHRIELELQNDELKKTRDDAEIARDHYTILFDTAPAAFLVVDPDGVIEQANFRAGDLLGSPRASIVGHSFYEFIARTDREAVQDALRHTRQKDPGEPRHAESPTVSLDVTACGRCYVELTAARWRRSGAPSDSGFLIALADVTATRELEEEQQQMVVYYRRLLKEMNHRVKNNLMVLSSIIDLERNRSGDGQTLERVAERVRNVSRVHTALYHGSADVDMVDVAASMKHFVEEFTRSLAAQVHIGFTPPGGEVFMDSRRALALSLTANELLTNAMQHAFPGGRAGKIHVSLRTRRGELFLDISDNGVGLEQSAAGGSAPPTGAGGVGTQLVMQLVDELGGRWDVSTDDGTHHTIRVPVRSPRADRKADRGAAKG
jgi:PAS domain S-box-containing protein